MTSRRHLSSRLVALAAAGVLVLSAAACRRIEGSDGSSQQRKPPKETRLALVYGDSLLRQGLAYLDETFIEPGWRVEAEAFPGLALCDMVHWFAEDAPRKPDLVVISTSGNLGLGGGCAPKSANQFDLYTRDSRDVAAFWQAAGAQVLWVDPPHDHPGDHPIVPILQATAAEFGQHFAYTTLDLRALDGSWPLRVPCTEREKAEAHCDPDGLVQLHQSSQNAHLCPVEYEGLDSCPVYSGGLARWIDAIHAAARAVMDEIEAADRPDRSRGQAPDQ